MHATLRARATYGDARTAVQSQSQIEYQAFARITSRLDESAALGAIAFPRLAAALHDNLRLWTIIAADVASEANELPTALRARLFYLSEFTREHTRKVLRREADPSALIEVNTTVMKGLRQQHERTSCPA